MAQPTIGGAVQEEEHLAKGYDARLMRRLLAYLRPYRGRVVVAVLLLLAGAMLELVGPWLTKVALDEAIPDGNVTLLGALAIAYLGTLALNVLMEYGQTLLTTWLGQSVMFDLRREVFGRLQRLPLSFYDRNPVGRLMTRVLNDVESLNQLFSSGVVAIFGDLFTLLFIMGAMLLMDWRLALVSFVAIPMAVGAAFFFRSRIRDANREIRLKLARVNAFLQEHIAGIGIVHLFGREQRTKAGFEAVDREYLKAYLRSITYYALFFPIIEVLTAVAFALIITYGGSQVLDGTLTVGVIAAFLQYARRFYRPIQDLADKYNMLQAAMASSERVFTLLDTAPAPDVVGGDPVRLPTPTRGEIEFRNVWFAYQKDDDGEWDWVLEDISFTARPGERVAIVGHTGAGKTSLISLLMRFYEPQKGEILLDGVPIRRVPVDDLRERIGLVLQDVFLFSRDVQYNIRLGREDIDDGRVHAAAARVNADRLINRLPAGYEEPLGERGASLSVGERQLLSFARALAFDPRVLILDEATSSVDSELEEQIEDAVDTLMKGRTALVIAHRLSTVQSADRILVFHHGELCEQGTHAELIEHGGIYARLYELQFERPADTAGAGAAANV